MNKDLKIIKTSDGSNSIYVQHLDEHYHSHHGAIQEAEHVFIKHGLDYFNAKETLCVLEVGFGTGLNAFLSSIYANKNNVCLTYVGVEAYPLKIELLKKLNYPSKIEGVNQKSVFSKIIDAPWGVKKQINEQFILQKVEAKIQETPLSINTFDVVFYDAFGPRAQEEMWDKTIFEKLYMVIKPNGFLVTYCAKGQLKRDLKALGFHVESLPGPPGKREMTRAIKRV